MIPTADLEAARARIMEPYSGDETQRYLQLLDRAYLARALLDEVTALRAALREAVNLASTNGAFCDPFTSGCDNPECKRLDALAALVTK